MVVAHSKGSYRVNRVDLTLVERLAAKNPFWITDDIVAQRYRSLLGDTQRVLAVPHGEKAKSLDWFGICLGWLSEKGAGRESLLIAFGGGVVGDLAGFVAASFMRGIAYVQVPTTLLAQVDSSVGGKVAIDLPQGKNLAGAFYPPVEVLVCGEFLHSLDRRQFLNGLAEVMKYGFISDPSLLSHAVRVEPGPELDRLVDSCISIKAAIVEADERETSGSRATLNFGHTLGHAIEAVLGYEQILHGEAISVGMACEAKLGESLGISQAGVADQVSGWLRKATLPLEHPVLAERDRLIEAMYRDKKVRGGKAGL